MKYRICFLSLLSLAGYAYANHPSSGASRLSDEQIGKALVALNEGEVEVSQIGARSAVHPEVKSFSQMMVKHHNENKNDTLVVVRQSQMRAKESDLSKSLHQEAMDLKQHLKDTAQRDFDRTFMNKQVEMHEKALAILRNNLIPNAKTRALRAHLEKTQAKVREHLDLARSVQSKL